jgi:hypothetical protein
LTLANFRLLNTVNRAGAGRTFARVFDAAKVARESAVSASWSRSAWP